MFPISYRDLELMLGRFCKPLPFRVCDPILVG
jgi:hypothetical protein